MTKSIVCLQPLSEELQNRIKEAAPDYTLSLTPARDPDQALLENAEIVVGWSKGIGDLLLREGGPLRWVQSWSAGVEKMPQDRLQERGILLTTASGVHAEPISAVIFGFILMFARHLHTAVRNQDRRRWHSDGTEIELSGKTAVIVGTGAIGTETAKIAKAFGMRTVGVRRSGNGQEHFDNMLKTDNLHEAVAEGDFIINTLPLTGETRGLFDASAFSAFKDGSYYINIGRGGTTDTNALIDALKSGQIRGAGLDVFETEPLPEDHPLWGMEQVIMTPHCAGATDRYAERVTELFVENLAYYLKNGKPSRNLVDYGRQY